MPNQNQTLFLAQLSQYLEIVSQNRPDVYPYVEVEKLLKSLEDGKCSGLVAIWFYYSYRHKKDFFYNSIVNPILSWNGRRESLSKALEQIMEEALSWTMWTQAEGLPFDLLAPIEEPVGVVFSEEYKAPPNNADIEPKHKNLGKTNSERLSAALGQSDYDISLDLIKERDYPEFRKEYEIAFVFKNDELSDFLKSIPPGKLIRLSGTDHAIGLVFDELKKKYILFDPNGFLVEENSDKRIFEKEFTPDEMDKLVQNIQNAFLYKANSLVTGVKIFILDDAQKTLPNYTSRVQIIKSILDKRYAKTGNTEIDISNLYDNRHALSFAASAGHLDVVEYLISQDAMLDKDSNQNQTAFYLAALRGHLPVVKILLEEMKHSSNYLHYLNEAFLQAVLSKQLPIVEYLLEMGAQLRSAEKSPKAMNALACASKEGNIPLLKRLLTAPGGLDLINDGTFWATPLYFAVQNNDHKTIEILMQNGAKLHISENFNKNLLHVAAESNHLRALRALLAFPEASQYIDAAIHTGERPLYLAARGGCLESVELLLKAGARPSREAMQEAIVQRNVAIMDALIKADSNLVHFMSTDGCSWLQIAIENNDVQAVHLLLEKGIDVMNTNDNSRNALHLAVAFNYPQIAKVLLDNFPTALALLNGRTNTGDTPLQLAQKMGNQALFKMIQEASQTYSKAAAKAKQEIHKNWIDTDYNVLIQTRMLYLLSQKQLQELELEILELSEYFSGLREGIVLSYLPLQRERLELIRTKVEQIQDSVHKKVDTFKVGNLSRKEKVIAESEKIYTSLLEDIQKAVHLAEQAQKALEAKGKASKPSSR